MGREEEPVLLPADRLLRRDDMKEACDRGVHPLDSKDAPLQPDGVEVVAGHDERKVGLESRAVDRAGRGEVLDHAFGQRAVSRPIQPLSPVPQRQAEVLTGPPGIQKVVGIRRQKEVPILGREQRRTAIGVVVRAGDADDEESDAVGSQLSEQGRERVHVSLEWPGRSGGRMRLRPPEPSSCRPRTDSRGGPRPWQWREDSRRRDPCRRPAPWRRSSGARRALVLESPWRHCKSRASPGERALTRPPRGGKLLPGNAHGPRPARRGQTA